MTIFSLLLLASSATGGVCPLSLNTTQSVLRMPAGWSAYQLPRKNELNGFMLFFDDPKTLRELPPDRSRTVDGKKQFVYVLPKQTKQVWVDCYYTDTGMVLRKRLPNDTRRCEVTRSRDGGLVESTKCM